jgi:hypothetical protein
VRKCNRNRVLEERLGEADTHEQDDQLFHSADIIVVSAAGTC